MEFQIITVMLVTLFFLLYREHRIGQRKLADTFKSEMDRLYHEIKALESDRSKPEDAPGPAGNKTEKVEAKLTSIPR